MVLLALAAGAAAVANLSTGVSAIDELLDVEQGYGGPGGLPAGRGTEPVDVVVFCSHESDRAVREERPVVALR